MKTSYSTTSLALLCLLISAAFNATTAPIATAKQTYNVYNCYSTYNSYQKKAQCSSTCPATLTNQTGPDIKRNTEWAHAVKGLTKLDQPNPKCYGPYEGGEFTNLDCTYDTSHHVFMTCQ